MALSKKCVADLEASIRNLNKKGKFAPATEDELKQLSDLCDGKMPEDMQKFFAECMPQEEVDLGDCVLYSLSRILAENNDYVPGCIIKPFGFVTIASTPDGDAFALDITKPKGHVYQCSHSLISEDGMSFYADEMVHLDLNYENIIKCSYDTDNNFSDFIKWAKYGSIGISSVVDYVIRKYGENT